MVFLLFVSIQNSEFHYIFPYIPLYFDDIFSLPFFLPSSHILLPNFHSFYSAWSAVLCRDSTDILEMASTTWERLFDVSSAEWRCLWLECATVQRGSGNLLFCNCSFSNFLRMCLDCDFQLLMLVSRWDWACLGGVAMDLVRIFEHRRLRVDVYFSQQVLPRSIFNFHYYSIEKLSDFQYGSFFDLWAIWSYYILQV